MKKYLGVFLLLIFLAGCILDTNLRPVTTSHGQAFEIDSKKNDEEYWMIGNLVKDAFDKHDFLAENSTVILNVEDAQRTIEELTLEEIENNIHAKYILGDDKYELVGVNPTSEARATEFAVRQNGKVILQKPMCFGADVPIINIQRIEGKIAITYVEGTCSVGETRLNVFFDGKTLNEEYGVEGSSYLFFYQNKIGFVANRGDKKYIYFNGQQVSDEFDLIPTTECCMSIRVLIIPYENGAFVFRASQGKEYYLVEIDLNKYL